MLPVTVRMTTMNWMTPSVTVRHSGCDIMSPGSSASIKPHETFFTGGIPGSTVEVCWSILPKAVNLYVSSSTEEAKALSCQTL